MYFEFLSTRTQFNSLLDIISPKVELVWCSSHENIMKQLVRRNDYNNFIYCMFLLFYFLSCFYFGFSLETEFFLNTNEEKENQRENTTRKQSRRKMNTNKRRTQVCSLLCPLIFWAPLLEYTYFSLCKNRKQSKMWFSFPDQFFFYLIYLIMNLCALLSTRKYWIKPLGHA